MYIYTLGYAIHCYENEIKVTKSYSVRSFQSFKWLVVSTGFLASNSGLSCSKVLESF